jgi:transposase
MKTLPFKLKLQEVRFLRSLKKGGKKSVRELNRINTLLLMDEGKSETRIAEFLGTDYTTVWRTKKNYLNNGLNVALHDRPRSGQPRKYTERHETVLVAIACSQSPEGRKRWTIRLLMERMRDHEGCPTMNRETVRLMLKKTKQSPG